MSFYISIGEVQRQFSRFYSRTGRKLTFPEMMEYLYENGMLTNTITPPAPSSICLDDFEEFSKKLFLTVDLQKSNPSDVKEEDVIPIHRDVLVISQFHDAKMVMHTHDYFEIDYVAKGTAEFLYDDNSRKMKEGEFNIVAPGLLHDVVLNDETILFCIMVRKSTFDTVFFSLLSRDDLLSSFFRNILNNGEHENFLVFYTDNNPKIKEMVFNAFLECHKNDPYGNNCCISWVNLLFSELLRNYSKSLQFYDYTMGTDFSLIMQYIKYNYRTLTLSFLAELFHYNEAYLSTIIKRNTGFSFSEIIKRQRIAEAEQYLVNTRIKVGEIAEKVGYNSADHFSRVFKSVYHMSPLEYRQKHYSTPKFDMF